jgi:hypothetical protein
MAVNDTTATIALGNSDRELATISGPYGDRSVYFATGERPLRLHIPALAFSAALKGPTKFSAVATPNYDVKVTESFDYEMTYTMRSAGKHQYYIASNSRSLAFSPRNSAIVFRGHKTYGNDEKIAVSALRLTTTPY